MRIVISQSMLFPWIGLLEQIRLAEVFVHYDDVQLSKGSFVNRVQLKTSDGMRWMTVPLKNIHLGQRINEVEIQPFSQWCNQHYDLLKRSLGGAPYFSEALAIVDEVYSKEYTNIGALARASMLTLAHYFGIDAISKFVDVMTLDVQGTGSDRVLQVTKNLDADVYITGHGASRYLNHEKFERSGVMVRYINYRQLPYPQSHGNFSPYVSGLDLVAHCGRGGVKYICSDTLSWRDFVS